jgi:hypothetical protein
MPSGRTHRIVSLAVLGEDGREVHKVMDSTASTRGPSHRADHVHSIDGALLNLAMRGRIAPKSPLHAALHQITDEAFDSMGRALPPGTPRRIGKLLMEEALQQAFRKRK